MSDSAQDLSAPGVETWRFAPGLHVSSVAAAIRLSDSGQIDYANHAMVSLLKVDSLSALRHKPFRDFLRDSMEWRHWAAARTEKIRRDFETCCIDSNGEEVFLRGDIWAEGDGNDGTGYISGIFVDVTPIHRLHRGLQQTARLEAIGGLTSGIIHDVNNILTVLQGNLYLAGDSVRSDPSAYEKIKRARDAAKRGGELTRQLLSFARGQDIASASVDPRKLVLNLAPLIGKALGSDITLKTAADRDLNLVYVNEAQLQSALVNLAVNARDAMSGDGTIVIRASNVRVSNSKSEAFGVAPGNYVQISVIDNGPGIPEELRSQVFEPFFSTKGPGRGTGLGLSMVRWLCEQAGGAVTLSSRLGHGTIISMLLPCSVQQATDTTEKTMPLSMLPNGNETVVLVASDEQMAWMVVQVLETLGYTLHVTTTSSDAEETIERSRADLAIVDTGAVGEDGVVRLADILKRRSAQTAMIVVHDSDLLEARSSMDILVRPFSPLDLARTVRRTLDGARDDN